MALIDFPNSPFSGQIYSSDSKSWVWNSFAWDAIANTVVGPQGPSGYQGTTGPQGAQGNIGPQGATGAQGPSGSGSMGDLSSPPAIGNTTPNTGIFTDLQSTKLTVNQGVISSNINVVSLNSTWNNTGVLFTGLKLNITDSGSSANSNLLDLQVSGVSQFSFNKTGNITFSNPVAVRESLGFVELSATEYQNLVTSGLTDPNKIYIATG